MHHLTPDATHDHQASRVLFTFVMTVVTVLSACPGTRSADKVNTSSSLEHNGVVWHFDKAVEAGTFANGDPWVKGPVTIVGIAPDAEVQVHDLGAGICNGGYTDRDCNARCEADHPGTSALCSESRAPNARGNCLCLLGRHGWQVNPAAGRVTSAFDSRVGHQAFDHRLIPSLPYSAQPGESMIKGTSRVEVLADPRPSVLTASVLTVLGESPPEGGAGVLRPPYVGTEKPLYRVEQLRLDLLPSLALLPDMPTHEQVANHVKYVQLEHISGHAGTIIRPENHLHYYAPANGGRRAEVALRLFFDEPLEVRLPTAIHFVQAGIDMLHALKNGQTWGPGGGEYPGMKLIMLMSAVLLGETQMVELVRNFESYEDESVSYGQDGQALWGHLNAYNDQEKAYWSDVVNNMIPGKSASRKTNRDPYGYIDGGMVPGTGYQICCSIQSFKGTSLVMQLMPVLKQYWDIPALHDYVDRMVSHGALTQPDPCAPPDPRDIAASISITDPGTHYGVTFGPDGNGSCIKDTDPSDGVGRFPAQDGVARDPRGSHGSSALVHAMYQAYRH